MTILNHKNLDKFNDYSKLKGNKNKMLNSANVTLLFSKILIIDAKMGKWNKAVLAVFPQILSSLTTELTPPLLFSIFKEEKYNL